VAAVVSLPPRPISAEVLVLDSSAFVKEIGLASGKGSALKHYLYTRGTQLVVPQATAEEYERNLLKRARGKILHVRKDLEWLAQFCGGVGGWSAPDDQVIKQHAKALVAGTSLGAILLPETAESRARAQSRHEAERPPSHKKAELGDCRIWEQCLELLSGHEVIFVAVDQDFQSHRKPEELHPSLRAEAEAVGSGRRLTFYPKIEALLGELKSEIPPIPDHAIFRFVYDAISDTVRELEANSGCRPRSIGPVKQTRFTTDAAELIEVRLQVKDTWESADGATELAFEFSGFCRYHLGDERLVNLTADNVRLLMTEPNGSVRAAKGSFVNVSASISTGPPPIQPQRGTLD